VPGSAGDLAVEDIVRRALGGASAAR